MSDMKTSRQARSMAKALRALADRVEAGEHVHVLLSYQDDKEHGLKGWGEKATLFYLAACAFKEVVK